MQNLDQNEKAGSEEKPMDSGGFVVPRTGEVATPTIEFGAGLKSPEPAEGAEFEDLRLKTTFWVGGQDEPPTLRYRGWQDGLLEWGSDEFPAIGKVVGLPGTRTPLFQSGNRRRADAMARQAWRRFVAAGFAPDNNGLQKSFGVFRMRTRQELKRKPFQLELEQLRLERRREMRLNPPWPVFVRVFF